jgi:multidrug efflux pump subunit AcrA (membrane-fusion protein)
MIKWTTIIAAILGIPLTLWAVQASTMPPPEIAPDESPPVNPFRNGIAAPGTVEAASRNVRVAAPEPGQIVRVFVQVNQPVKLGEPLFQLDPRLTEADLARAEAVVTVAQRELERLRGLPRPEEVARLQAVVDETVARFEHKRRERARRIHVRGALSSQDLGDAVLALNEAAAGRTQAEADLNRVRAGAWKHDLSVAEATVRRAQVEAEMIRARRDRLTVRSPIDGTVLKCYRLFASSGAAPDSDIAELGTDVNDVAFSPDGTRLASAHGDGSVRVWDVLLSTSRLLVTTAADVSWDLDTWLFFAGWGPLPIGSAWDATWLVFAM